MPHPPSATPAPKLVCPQCQMGTLHPQRIVFAHWFEGQFITIPNFPAWACDICGLCEYDPVALEQLELILGPEADLRREMANRVRRPRAQTPPNGRKKT